MYFGLFFFFFLTVYINFQVLPNDMLDFLDAPVPYIVSFLISEFVGIVDILECYAPELDLTSFRFRKEILIMQVVVL